MKSNSRKRGGFTLLEVIISMAIIGIISVGVYNGYILLIKQTKAGQVRQTTALEGKQVIEEIKAAIDSNDFTVGQNNLKVGNINFINSNGSFIRYLDENYNDVDANSYKYLEKITLSGTKAAIGDSKNIIDVKPPGGLGAEYLSTDAGILDYEISIKNTNNSSIEIDSKENSDSEIQDIGTSPQTISLDTDGNLSLSVWASFDSSKNQKKIDVKDNSGKIIFTRIFEDIQNEDVQKQIKFIVNLEDYQNNSTDNLPHIQINSYNQDSQTLNVFLDKSSNLNVDVQNHKGQVNIYGNGAEEKTPIGDLYDVKVEVDDKNGNNLFTGYSNENIDLENN